MLGASTFDRAPHRATRGRIETRRRLVENQHRPITDQRRANACQPALTAGELRDRPVGELAEPEFVDHRVARGARAGPRKSAQPRGRFKGVGGRQVGERGVVLRQVGDEIRDDAGLGDDVTAEEFDAPGVGPQQSDELPNQARLARAVGAEQAEHLTAADLEVDAVSRGDVA